MTNLVGAVITAPYRTHFLYQNNKLQFTPRSGVDSENAGMSSENYVGIIMAENLRFPGEGSSSQG